MHSAGLHHGDPAMNYRYDDSSHPNVESRRAGEGEPRLACRTRGFRTPCSEDQKVLACQVPLHPPVSCRDIPHGYLHPAFSHSHEPSPFCLEISFIDA
ncbi:hypothetical protein CesoFtcFv8_017984 [Champsocephalus esox]|uniref:Uncharacterized protein n=1 Tax=Champsocephalus esox TaxID=159716 RepID=A0AAN8BLE3_9TELE|nr:hypothetical protein CesoFtcFv8_017984 [Champsocephalus esox]